jgi:hypothetical protein
MVVWFKVVVTCICLCVASFFAGYFKAKYEHRIELKIKAKDEITILNFEANEELQKKIDALHLDDVDDNRLHAITDSLARQFERQYPSTDSKRKTL